VAIEQPLKTAGVAIQMGFTILYFTPHPSTFNQYGNVTVSSEGWQNLSSWFSSKEGSPSYHICCDMGAASFDGTSH
jgi:hypothetical protein